ncbi:MAG: hypothetical protein MOB07_17880 [Acidobacteria bacterium]|nr:hypothetical protein [Acidobacteriota bacterium]
MRRLKEQDTTGIKKQSAITYALITLYMLLLSTGAFAQNSITSLYFYDDKGRLTKVIDSSGVLAIFNFTPQQGQPGAVATINGQMFSPAPSGNTVKFNGVVATVLSATATKLALIIVSAIGTADFHGYYGLSRIICVDPLHP